MNIIKVYRVSDWYYYLGFIIFGFLLNCSLDAKFLIPLLTGSFILAYAFSLNDFYDKRKKAYFIIPLILSVIILPFLTITQLLLALFFLLIVTFYSAKPFCLKQKPFISSFCNGVGFTILFLLGYTVKNLDMRGLIFSLLFFSFNMVAQLIHEIVDLKEDKKKRIITTAVFLGVDIVKKLCYIFLWSTIFISFYLFYLNFVNYFFTIVTLIFVLFFTYRIFNKKIDKNLRKEYRNFSIIVGFIYLLLLF